MYNFLNLYQNYVLNYIIFLHWYLEDTFNWVCIKCWINKIIDILKVTSYQNYVLKIWLENFILKSYIKKTILKWWFECINLY